VNVYKHYETPEKEDHCKCRRMYGSEAGSRHHRPLGRLQPS